MINPRVLGVQESATVKIADLVRDMEHEGKRVIKLQTGDPDFATPPVVIEAAYRAMRDGFTHYNASRGLPQLRDAIADKLNRENGFQADPATEILVTHGAIHAIFITMQTILKPGDEVILIEPFYPSYASATRLAGGVPVTVETDPRQGFALDIDRIRSKISPRTRLVVINSPSNPTGVVLGQGEIESVVELACEHGIFVLHDEVYEKLIYEGEHISVAAFPEARELSIVINSLSKTFAMTGWRVGYVVAHPDIIAQMLKVLQFSATNIAPFIQVAAVTALTTSELSGFIETMRETYDRRRQAALTLVAQTEGLEALRPRGAFYLMLDVSQFCQDSTDFSHRLLERANVAVVPGVAFGRSSEGWLRLTFAADQETLIEGIDRIGRFASSEYVESVDRRVH